MKNDIKAILFMIAFSVCLSWAGLVWTATPIDLTVDGVAVVWDGETVRLGRATNLAAQPETRRGTTYAPVRLVAEVLGRRCAMRRPALRSIATGGVCDLPRVIERRTLTVRR